jgi:hypothetical protein
MADLNELRKKYPQYSDLSDKEFANSFHKKYYSDIPIDIFYEKIGLKKEEPKTGWESVLSDVMSSAKETPAALGSMLSELPGMAYESGKQVLTDPMRSLQNLEYGALGGVRGAMNIPSNIAQYLKSKDIGKGSPVEEFIAKLHMPETDIEKFFKPQGMQGGDVLLQGIGSYSPFGRIGSLTKGITGTAQRAGAAGAYGIGQNQDPIQAALMGLAGEGAVKAAQRITTPGTFLPSSPLSDQELLASVKQAQGTEASLGNVIENPFLKKTFENVIAETPMSGAVSSMQRTAKILKNRGENILGTLKGDFDTSDIGSTLQTALRTAEKETRAEKNAKFNKLNEAAEKAGISTDRSKLRDIASEEWLKIQDDPDLARLTDPSTQKLLKDIAESKSKNNSLKKTDLLRAKLGDKARDAYTSGNSELGQIYASLRDAALEDINSAIDSKKAPDNLKTLRDEAMSYYKKEWLPFEEREITKFTREGGDPDILVQSFIKNSKLSDRSRLLKKLTEKLNPEERNLLAHSYLSNAVDEGGLNPLKMRTLYKNLGEGQKEAIFGKDSQLKKNIEDYTNFVGKNTEPFELMFNPKTGARAGAFPWLASAGGVGTALLSGHLPLPVAAAALPILAARPAAKVLTNKLLREKIVNSMIKARAKNAAKPVPKNIAPYVQNIIESSEKKD